MFRAIKDPKDILASITDDFKGVFKDGLISIILYGSAVSGDYIPGQSDINFLVVVSEDAVARLEETFEIVSRWKKRRVATPLFLTETYIRTSVDVFPIEYLNFQHNRLVVYGKDILADLDFDPRYVRLQCERDIKGKLLLLREAFVETEGKGQRLQDTVAESLGSFLAVFAALLFLKKVTIPKKRREIVHAVCHTFEMDEDLFGRLMDIKERRVKLSQKELQTVFKAYLNEVGKLSALIDSL